MKRPASVDEAVLFRPIDIRKHLDKMVEADARTEAEARDSWGRWGGLATAEDGEAVQRALVGELVGETLLVG